MGISPFPPHPLFFSVLIEQVHSLSTLDWKWSQCCSGVFGDMTGMRNSNFPQRLKKTKKRHFKSPQRECWEWHESCGDLQQWAFFKNTLWLCLWNWCKMYFGKLCRKSLQKIRFHIVLKWISSQSVFDKDGRYVSLNNRGAVWIGYSTAKS